MIDLSNRLEPYIGEIGSICIKTGANDEDRTTDDLISRKMAIETVSNMLAVTATQKDMVEDCLEILENLPSLKFATDINVGDNISRQAAINAFDDAGFCTHGYIVDVLEGLPSAQTEQKKGIWLSKNLPICIGAKELVEVYICSNCGHVVDVDDISNFCSVCGCDMRGESYGNN